MCLVGRHGADHANVGISAQDVLQEVGELGVAVGDVAALALLREFVDNLTQSEKTLVDVLAFATTLGIRDCLLGTGQVNEGQSRDANVLLPVSYTRA